MELMGSKDLKIEMPSGYTKAGEGDRHGSYEWAWSKWIGDLNYFVTASLTHDVVEYQAEVWIGADNGLRYTRDLFAQFSVHPTQTAKEVEEQLNELVKSAAERAEKLTADDLTDTRVSTYSMSERKELIELAKKPQGDDNSEE